MSLVWRAWQHAARVFGSHRKLWLPFVAAALFEAALLGLVWLAPQPPFSSLLAPPIRFFFGDRMLHYPWHLWFLYHVMKHTHLITSIVFGAFMTGLACAMVRQIHEGRAPVIREALASGGVRYGTVSFLWLLVSVLAIGLGRLMARAVGPGPRMVWAVVGMTLALQALFIYVIPVAVFEPGRWWRTLGRAVRETLAHPLSTLLVVGPPSAAAVGAALLASDAQVSRWMLKTEPEIAVPLVAARLIFLTVVDALVTIAAAHLWWLRRRPAGEPGAPAFAALPGSARPATSGAGG